MGKLHELFTLKGSLFQFTRKDHPFSCDNIMSDSVADLVPIINMVHNTENWMRDFHPGVITQEVIRSGKLALNLQMVDSVGKLALDSFEGWIIENLKKMECYVVAFCRNEFAILRANYTFYLSSMKEEALEVRKGLTEEDEYL